MDEDELSDVPVLGFDEVSVMVCAVDEHDPLVVLLVDREPVLLSRRSDLPQLISALTSVLEDTHAQA